MSARAALVAALAAVLLAAASVVVLITSNGSSTTQAPSLPNSASLQAPDTGFAGYNALAFVNDVSARWRVPRILPGSPTGDAATWIGSQNVGQPIDFAQVGTVEDVGSGFLGQSSARSARYSGFWSDSAVDYRPQLMGAVAPGDEVEAEMTRHPTGWVLRLSDLTAGWTHVAEPSMPVPQGAQVASWIEEDPSPAVMSGADLPYPKMDSVTFEDMRLNGRVPPLSVEDGEVLLSPNGVYLVPSPVVDGRFSVDPARGFQRQYLADVAPYAYLLNHRPDLFSRSTYVDGPPAVRRTTASVVLDTLGTLESKLAGQAWPPDARQAVLGQAAADGQLVTDLIRWRDQRYKQTSPAITALVADSTRSRPAADFARYALGLPPG